MKGAAGRELRDVTITPGDQNVETVVNATSTQVKVKVDLGQARRISSMVDVLKPGLFPLEKAEPAPVPVTGRKFTGSESARTGINGLTIADDVTMVIVPDLITAATKADGTVDLGLWKAVQTSLISHCEQQGNRMAVLDSPPGMTVQQIKEWRADVAMYDSASSPPSTTRGSRSRTRRDQRRPRGLRAAVRPHRWRLGPHRRDPRRVEGPGQRHHPGLPRRRAPITKTEQALLNPIGINCIRPFGTRGIRIWGARTLSSDSDWRYINVRRLFNMVETTILDGTQWAVFEPNDVKLWEGVSRTLTGFLTGLWRDGGAVRHLGRPGLLRQVRRRDQPARLDRRGQARGRGGHRAGEAGRVRHLPYQPAEAGSASRGRAQS